jgi:hypothetical protein
VKIDPSRVNEPGYLQSLVEAERKLHQEQAKEEAEDRDQKKFRLRMLGGLTS